MNWEISWALCRTCMDADSELFPLYDETNQINLSKNLAELAEIEISKSDGLPTKLCEKCISKIIDYSKFKQLVQESDRKLKSMFISEFSYETKSNQKKDTSDKQMEDQVENQTEDQVEDQIENQMKNQMKKQMEEQVEDQRENQIEKQLEEQIEEQVYTGSEIDMAEGCIFDNGDESSADKIEENCVQELNSMVEKETENSINNICYIDGINCEQNIQDILKSNTWKIVYNKKKTDIAAEESNSAQSIPFVVNEEVEKQELINKNEKKRKNLTKTKTEKKKIKENIENLTADIKETNNNSDGSDFEIDNQDNIVGSLNDTITKVKEIRENGKAVCYQCTLCLQNYEVLADALSHLVDLHVPVSGPFYCVVCEMDCENIKHLKNHVKIHKGDNPYICFICNKAYVMKRYLKRHMVCHTDFPRHRCVKCGERFKLKIDLEIHAKSHNEEVAFSCSQCTKVFNHKGNYKRHLISHLDPQGVHIPKYPCQVCSKRFLNNRNLANHMRVHTRERPFKCNLCDKRFSQKGNLLNHAKIHTNPRSFVCDVCGKKFNQKSTLKDHTRIHTGEKYYVCSVCGASFTFSAALGRHMWTHSDKKPFTCDICDATFIGNYDLKRHMKTHNGNAKRKHKSKKMNEEETIDLSEDVSDIAEENSDGNTIVIEQIFLCDDSIQIISPQDSGKENTDSLLCLI